MTDDEKIVARLPAGIPDRDVLHVVPQNDLRTHDCAGHCWCAPRIAVDAGGYIVIHNSLDGREAHENLADIGPTEYPH